MTQDSVVSESGHPHTLFNILERFIVCRAKFDRKPRVCYCNLMNTLISKITLSIVGVPLLAHTLAIRSSLDVAYIFTKVDRPVAEDVWHTLTTDHSENTVESVVEVVSGVPFGR